MTKTLGGRLLLLVSIGFAVFFMGINQAVAILCLIGSLILGYREGFDAALVIMASMSGVLLVADIIATVSVKPEKILKSAWPNLFISLVRFVYLVFAGLLLYGLFWDGILEKYYWIYFVIAIWLTAVNLPWMIFHLTLCVPKCRKYMLELDARLRCACSDECDCQNPPPENWDGKDGVHCISNECPVHNFNPKTNPDCHIHNQAD